MHEYWKQIEEFPIYHVSNLGRVAVFTPEGDITRVVSVSVTKQGAPKVNLFRDGKPYSRSTKVLVAEAFVGGQTPIFDTPIILDGIQTHVYEDNILWRPRWFAWKYTNQFLQPSSMYADHGPLLDMDNDVWYDDVRSAAVANGLLFSDVWFSACTYRTDRHHVAFPTRQRFMRDW